MAEHGARCSSISLFTEATQPPHPCPAPVSSHTVRTLEQPDRTAFAIRRWLTRSQWQTTKVRLSLVRYS